MKKATLSFRVAGLLLGLVVMLASSSPLLAQEHAKVVHCTFVLPFDVQWQDRTLPAGEYHFTGSFESSDALGSLAIRDAQDRPKMIVQPLTLDQGAEPSGESALIIVNHNGKRYVRSLKLGAMGTTRTYSVPKLTDAERRELEAPPQVIPVQIAGDRN